LAVMEVIGGGVIKSSARTRLCGLRFCLLEYVSWACWQPANANEPRQIDASAHRAALPLISYPSSVDEFRRLCSGTRWRVRLGHVLKRHDGRSALFKPSGQRFATARRLTIKMAVGRPLSCLCAPFTRSRAPGRAVTRVYGLYVSDLRRRTLVFGAQVMQYL